MMAEEPKVLELELAFFEKNRDQWASQHAGKHLLIKGEELVDTFNKPEDAVEEGARRFGNTPFLVRNVNDPIDNVNFVPVLSLGLI